MRELLVICSGDKSVASRLARAKPAAQPLSWRPMRARVVLTGAVAAVALGAVADAQAPAPTGNFGGGALVAPPNNHFGPGNAVVALRALPDRKLEIEATVRGSCSGGDI